MNKEQLLIALRKELFKKSYYEFFKYFWEELSPEPLVDNWHIKEVCDELQKVGERIIRREAKEYDLIINIPPASSKSSIITIIFPVWLWSQDDTLKILSGSYAQSLSIDHAVKSRNIINSGKFKELYPHINLKEDSNNKSSYDTDNKGNRTATSVGSGIIGRHFHLQIVDDPIIATANKLEVDTANEWIGVTLSTRKINKDITPLIMVMQRIREDDPTDYLLSKGNNIKHICLPAELTDKTTLEYRRFYTDGLFDIKRLSRRILNQSKSELGSKAYSGQYLQSPIPSEGTIIKKEWIPVKQLITEEDTKMYSNIVWHLFIDSAYTENTKNDPTGIIVCGILNNTLIIKEAFQLWLEYPQLLERIKTLAAIYGRSNSKIYIEPKASGKSIAQGLKNLTRLNVIELEAPKDSKLTRVNAAAPVFESKRVIVLDGNWNTIYIEECTSFPYAKHDDMLDCTCHAIDKLIQSKTTLSYKSA